MAHAHLTDRTIRHLRTSRVQEDFWDENGLPGFGVRVSEHGRKSFVLMYRAAGRKRRCATTARSWPQRWTLTADGEAS